MNEVTVTLPAIDETVIANLDTLTNQASATEAEALRAIREKYAVLAKQNGFIRIAHYAVTNTDWSTDNNIYYERNGRKLRALLAFDNFTDANSDQNSGTLAGDKLYLAQTGEWIRIERRGAWSQWQGAPNYWGCGVSAKETDDQYDQDNIGGSVRVLTDEQVEAEYPLDGIVEELGKSLTKLAGKLPERMVRVQRRVDLAAQLLAGLKQEKGK